MFGKLLKHEFRSQRSLFGWLTVAALGAAVIGAGALQLLIHILREEMYAAATIVNESREGFLILATIALMLLVMALVFAIAAYGAAVRLMLIYRFYKHHFTDEGYLTFTLPATTHQLLLSSTTNIIIWNLISGIVTVVGLLGMFTPLFVLAGQEGADIFAEIAYVFTEIYGNGFFVLYAVMLICTALGTTILPLLAVTIGAQISKKYKLLAGIGVFIGLNMAVSFVTGIVSAISAIADLFMLEASGVMTLTYLTPSVLYLGIAIGGYYLMHHMVSRKLNLT